MEKMDLFILIIGCICLLASLLVWLFGGEKYMKWYYRYVGDYRNYDTVVIANWTLIYTVCKKK